MNYLILIVLLLGITALHVLIGGTRLVFSQPGYALIGLAAVLGAILPGRFRLPARPFPLIVTGLFFAWVLGRALTSPVEYLARFHIYAALAVMAVYLLFATRLTHRKERTFALWVLLILCIPHLIVAAIQFSTGDNSFNFLGIIRPAWGWRASGMYMCPTNFGSIMAVFTLMAVALTLWGRLGVAPRMLMGYMAMACMAGVVIAGSRGPYLAIACGFLCFFTISVVGGWRIHNAKLIWMILGLLVLIAAMVGGALVWIKANPEMMQRLENSFDMKNMRFEMWEAAFMQWQLNPWFGTGSWTFYYFGRLFRPIGGYQHDAIHTHNDYVQTLAEYGIIGFALMVVFIVAHVGSGWDSAKYLHRRMEADGRKTSDTLGLITGALCGVAIWAAHAVVDFNMHIPATVVIVGMWFAFLANPAVGEARRESVNSALFGWTLRLSLAAIGGVILWIAVRHWPAEVHAERARVAVRDGNFLEAIREARAGLKKDPTNPYLHFHLGDARYDMAASIGLEPLRRSMAYQAAKDLERGLEMYPHDMFRMVTYGLALNLAGQTTEAGNAFDRAVELDPASGIGFYYRGLHLRNQGRLEEAKADVRRARELRVGSVISGADTNWAK